MSDDITPMMGPRDMKRHTFSIAWWHVKAGPALFKEALLLVVRRRLNLPCCKSQTRCAYTFPHSGQICGARLDSHVLQTGACTCADRIARHDLLRDWLATFAREAGFQAHIEQDVPSGLDGTRASDGKYADVVLTDWRGPLLPLTSLYAAS